MLHRLLLLLLALSGPGCHEDPSPQPIDDGIRIVSLSPAITRAIEDLGLAGSLVGRSTWCKLESRDVQAIPAVGDLHDRDWERLVRLRPTHVLFQSSAVDTDASLMELSESHSWNLQAWPLRTMVEVREMLDDMPMLFAASGNVEDIRRRAHEGSNAIQEAINPAEAYLDVEVLIVSEGQPALAWGESTYLGEILAGTGAGNVMGTAAWKSISLEDIIRMEPDVILIVSETGSSDTSLFDQLDIPATRQQRVHHLSHPHINLPGAHLATMANQIRSAVLEPVGSP